MRSRENNHQTNFAAESSGAGGRRKVTNFEVLKQMPLKSFANMVFNVARRDSNSLEEFEAFLSQEIPKHLEQTIEKALQEMQRLSRG